MKKVLIANRGEIAVRVIRALREMGLPSVAVYSKADKYAMHARIADEAVCIGGNHAKDSYLNAYNILSAAEVTGSDAIHPGYGFLSENTQFVRMCNQSNITFIGPNVNAMDAMGHKLNARILMHEAGVPVIPGTFEKLKDVKDARKAAKKIGYPVMIKAAVGGGGRGIRKVLNENDMLAAFASASEEALAAFGNADLYMEKCIENARHIEVQLLCDKHGHAVHLYERECSLQRRSQKIMEEAPSPILSKELREKIGRSAVKAALKVGYDSAGTVEFLVEKKTGNYYFMELNARIQVEHPITEMITGIDIVKNQIASAAGLELPFKQSDIHLHGHAIECRINAEDPDRNFAPCAGKIKALHVPGGFGVRFDSAIYEGCTIPPYYDSMIGKMITHGVDRDEALAKMRSCLDELEIEGLTTNIPFHFRLLTNRDIVNGKMDINFIDREMGDKK